MKKLLIVVLMLFFLTACSADNITEETAATPSVDSLDAAPTATAEPSAEPTDEPTAEPTNTAAPTDTPIPTTTPSTEPTPTETAEPTAVEGTQTEPPSENTGTIPEEFQLPEGAVVGFTQSGGFTGLSDVWVFYPDGRVTLNGADQAQLTADRISTLIDDLAALDFFETSYITKPGTYCCDFFEYTLAVQTESGQNFISFSEGDLSLPRNIQDMLALMREVTTEAQVR